MSNQVISAMTHDLGKAQPLDGLLGALLRNLGLLGLGALFGLAAMQTALTDGVSLELGRYRAWVFFVPAITALLSLAAGLRGAWWVTLGLTASERQFLLCQRNLLQEMLFGGIGGVCLVLGNIPGMAMDLGPFGLLLVLTGIGFLAGPQAIFIDGERRQILVSGILWADRRPFGNTTIRPICEISRPSGFKAWYVGLNAVDRSGAISEEQAMRIAAYVRARTGLGAEAAIAAALAAVPPSVRPVVAPVTDPSTVVLPRQRRLLLDHATFAAINEAMYAAGFRSTRAIDSADPELAIWERGAARITYERHQGMKRLLIENLAPGAVPSLPTLDPAAIDLSLAQPAAALVVALERLAWLTTSPSGWAGLPGAARWARGEGAPPAAFSQITALRAASDPTVVAKASELASQWAAQHARAHH